MKRSGQSILTTHVGSLPRPDDDWRSAQPLGSADVAAVVARQREVGIDIVNEGEYTKGGDWLSYVEDRFGGFEARPPKGGVPVIAQGKDREQFDEFYRDASERGSLFHQKGTAKPRPHWVATAPIAYMGQAAIAHETKVLRAAVGEGAEAFLTSTAPSSLEPYWNNEYYKTQEEFVFALAEAMRTEYEAIAGAGFILQVDDAWLPALWDRIGMQMGLPAFRKYCAVRIEALNHALRNIPEEKVRYHLCWGSWHGPHAFDIELREIVALMLSVKAQAYLIEAANARHQHEYIVWDDVKLPAGKILVPGVVTHSTDGIEHPELVSQRLQRYAQRVGKENVMAGTDCGFGGRSHPQIAWAKLKALVDGAALASKALG